MFSEKNFAFVVTKIICPSDSKMVLAVFFQEVGAGLRLVLNVLGRFLFCEAFRNISCSNLSEGGTYISSF